MSDSLTSCPVCGNKKFTEFIQGKDFFLSGESFTIQQCTNCHYRFTYSPPSPDEIGKYYESDKYISHDSQKLSITTIAYKVARYFAIRNKFSIINSYSKGKRLLDIGCGTGELLYYCSKKGLLVKGIEPNLKARQFAVNKYKLEISEDFSGKILANEKFDCITLWHVLEHLHKPDETLNQIKRMINPHGVLIIAVPNSDSWEATHYKKYWAAYDLPRHISHFTYNTLEYFLDKNNYSLIRCLPQKLDAFYISLLSEQYKTGRKNFLKAFLRGMQSNFYGQRPEFRYSSIIFILSPKISYF
jgi:2-polyprenyl-3-methyl-5-hydroxy-6-metoxy-1,4-benzoquinol methylase